MARGSRFSSILQWFREGDADEVRAIFPLVQEAVAARSGEESTAIRVGSQPVQRSRKQRSASAKKAWETRRANAAAPAAAAATGAD